MDEEAGTGVVVLTEYTPEAIAAEKARRAENRVLFQRELELLINRFSWENGSDTPDFILAEYLVECLDSFEKITQQREKWYGRTKS